MAHTITGNSGGVSTKCSAAHKHRSIEKTSWRKRCLRCILRDYQPGKKVQSERLLGREHRHRGKESKED